jgi:hypothetical protein
MKVQVLACEARVVVLVALEIVAAIDAYRRRGGIIPRGEAIRQLIEKGRKVARKRQGEVYPPRYQRRQPMRRSRPRSGRTGPTPSLDATCVRGLFFFLQGRRVQPSPSRFH